MKQAINNANDAAVAAASKQTDMLMYNASKGIPSSGTTNVNIYQQMHQMSMYRRSGFERDFESIQQIEEIGEDNNDDIKSRGLSRNGDDENMVQRFTNEDLLDEGQSMDLPKDFSMAHPDERKGTPNEQLRIPSMQRGFNIGSSLDESSFKLVDQSNQLQPFADLDQEDMEHSEEEAKDIVIMGHGGMS